MAQNGARGAKRAQMEDNMNGTSSGTTSGRGSRKRPSSSAATAAGVGAQPLDLAAVFHSSLKAAREERKEGNKTPVAAAARKKLRPRPPPSKEPSEAQKWFSELAPAERDVVEQGLRAIIYQGCTAAAKEKFDNLVREKPAGSKR